MNGRNFQYFVSHPQTISFYCVVRMAISMILLRYVHSYAYFEKTFEDFLRISLIGIEVDFLLVFITIRFLVSLYFLTHTQNSQQVYIHISNFQSNQV